MRSCFDCLQVRTQGGLKQKVAERRAETQDVIGLAAAVSALGIGPRGKGCKGSRTAKGKAKAKARRAKKTSEQEDKVDDNQTPEDMPPEDTDSLGSPDEKEEDEAEPDKTQKKAAAKVKAKAKAKSSGKKRSRKQAGDGDRVDGRKARGFPKSHLVDEWKKFVAAERAKLDGKVPYHQIMKDAAAKSPAQFSEV